MNIFEAIRALDVAKVKEILATIEDVNQKNEEGLTPLLATVSIFKEILHDDDDFHDEFKRIHGQECFDFYDPRELCLEIAKLIISHEHVNLNASFPDKTSALENLIPFCVYSYGEDPGPDIMEFVELFLSAAHIRLVRREEPGKVKWF